MIDTILKETFGYERFREGQREVIEDVLKGYDVFAMLPTGSGKSLCYILPGYVLDGLVLIVSPLLSLMEDQVQQIRMLGEKKVAALNSFLTPQEKDDVLNSIRFLRFLFVSPEMLQNNLLINRLSMLKLSLFVIDEAHCISQWGHEFRPDYLKLAQIREAVGKPPCLALTATANPKVRQDILNYLDFKDDRQHIYSVDRKNISLFVDKLANVEEKIKRTIKIISSQPSPGIIYCSTRDWTERLANQIRMKTDLHVAYYHGGLSSDDRLAIQYQFLNDQLDIICCTNAFGMGINKPNVRLVLHFHYPKHMNAYIQEIGRAGRDGLPSAAVTLYTDEDDLLPQALIEKEYPDQPMLLRILNRMEATGAKAGTKGCFSIMMEEGASETAARFLTYQLTKVFPEEHKSEELFSKIDQTIKLRKQKKISELYEVKRWLATTDCRREAYLNSFQEKLSDKVPCCCDACGCLLDDFVKVDPVIKETQRIGWQVRLRKLLGLDKIDHE
ncbi:ATP-dependent DNA helicase RecQ [Scopulibacillus darangshiensis]|uniref:ATP-dependent DNA helicase RecQ n=1 Tax=Scopulibacillus darangshiensis TaxID=442528 RepID=A0A4R2P9H1_9BACL|nr:ATP-dependent DNA helicase RecQ [Scopulibacillus darangshiensis]TCP31679.1 ATP-dependent DNA helicase RecQ [Scopulibacillus darangshiensis]